MNPAIHILLADDHKILREGLENLLKHELDFKIVGHAANGREAVHMAAELKPDIVCMDVRMPDLNGIDATHQMVAKEPEIKVIALSACMDYGIVMDMLRAGARGFVHKDGSYEELIRAIRIVMGGKIFLTSQISHEIVGNFSDENNKPPKSIFEKLSSRERQVLQLLVEGRTTKQAALELQVSAKTIETHRLSIMDKLNLFTLSELTKFAIRNGLTDVEK